MGYFKRFNIEEKYMIVKAEISLDELEDNFYLSRFHIIKLGSLLLLNSWMSIYH